MKQKLAFTVLGVQLLFAVTLGMAQVNVLTYHIDNSRDGQNTNEIILCPANVNTNTFGKLFSHTVDGYVYAQPLYVSGVNIPGQGTHDVLIIATEHDTVYAFDADSTSGPSGGLLWQTNLGPYAVTTIAGVYTNKNFGCRYNNGVSTPNNSGQYTDIVPSVGITGTPVIDPVSGTLYVDAFTGEISGGVTNYYHRIHALNLATGAEQPNSPVVVTASVPGTGVDSAAGVVTFNATQSLQRGALTLAGGKLYVPYTGYADTDPYHGWVIGFDPVTLQQLTNYVFNTTPNATVGTFGAHAAEGGIWGGGGGIAVDANTNLYLEVANGSFSATNGSGGIDFGDSFMKLSTTNGLAVADYFTVYNQASLQSGDLDLGSGGLILLPGQTGSYTNLLLGAGKQGKIYVVNRDQLTLDNNHYDSTFDSVVQTTASGVIGGSFGTPAYFNGEIYYGGTSDKLKAFSLTAGVLSGSAVSTATRSYGFPGATPSVSANGTSNGIVWALQNASPAVLVAYAAGNLTSEIYNSSQAAGSRDQLASGVKFAVPIIANGKVFVGNQLSVSVFGLLDPYLNWKYFYFGNNATNPAVAGDLADPDGDGVVNLMEYALATNPNVPNTTPSVTGLVAGNQFQFNFHRNTAATNLTYVVQTTDALGGGWTNLMTYTSASGWVANVVGATASESTPQSVPPNQYVTATITDPTDLTTLGAGSRFYRLAVH
jgi:hypothetical protein